MPRPTLALVNDLFTHSLNKKEVKTNSAPIDPQYLEDDAQDPNLATAPAPDPVPVPTKENKGKGKGKGGKGANGHATAPSGANGHATASNGANGHATAPNGANGHVTAPLATGDHATSPTGFDLLSQLMALKNKREFEASRAEQAKKDKERDTKTQKRCGFFLCGPSNTVSTSVWLCMSPFQVRQSTSITGCVRWLVGRSAGLLVKYSFHNPHRRTY